jgi:hypothetical protein
MAYIPPLPVQQPSLPPRVADRRRRGQDRRQGWVARPETAPLIVPSPASTPGTFAAVAPAIVGPSPASTPGAFVLPTRSPTFNLVPRTIGRDEDQDLVAPLLDVPYDPAMFSVNGSGSWTVPASSLQTYAYQRLGHLVAFMFYTNPTTIAGTVNSLNVRLPISPVIRLGTAGVNLSTEVAIAESGPPSQGGVADNVVTIYRLSGSAFTPGSLLVAFSLYYFV